MHDVCPAKEKVPTAQAVFTVPEHAKPAGQGTQAVPVFEKPGLHIKLDVEQDTIFVGHVIHVPPIIEL